MKHHQNSTAIKALSVGVLLFAAHLGWAAQVVGTIVSLRGPLQARKANGSVMALALSSQVEEGDTLIAAENTYAQIRFTDNSDIILKPNTTFVVGKALKRSKTATPKAAVPADAKIDSSGQHHWSQQ